MGTITIDLKSLGLNLTRGVQYRFDLDEDFVHDTTYKLPNNANDNLILIEGKGPSIQSIDFGKGDVILVTIDAFSISESTDVYIQNDYIATNYFSSGPVGQIHLYDESSTLIKAFNVPDEVQQLDNTTLAIPALGLLTDGITYQLYFEADLFEDAVGVKNTAQEIDFVYADQGDNNIASTIASTITLETLPSAILFDGNWTPYEIGSYPSQYGPQYLGLSVQCNNDYYVFHGYTAFTTTPTMSVRDHSNTFLDSVANNSNNTMRITDGGQYNDAFLWSGTGQGLSLNLGTINNLNALDISANNNHIVVTKDTQKIAYHTTGSGSVQQVKLSFSTTNTGASFNTINQPSGSSSTWGDNLAISNAYLAVADITNEQVYIYRVSNRELINTLDAPNITAAGSTTPDNCAISGKFFYYLNGTTPNSIDIFTNNRTHGPLPTSARTISANENLVAFGDYVAQTASVYRSSNNSLIRSFTNPNGTDVDRFGYSVDVTENLLMIGSPYWPNNAKYGKVYVYN